LQESGEKRMIVVAGRVAVPLPVEEEVFPIDAIQFLLCVGDLEEGIAEGGGQAAQDRSVSQEFTQLSRLSLQHFRGQVSRKGTSRFLQVAQGFFQVPQAERSPQGQLHGDGPALGAGHQGLQLDGGNVHPVGIHSEVSGLIGDEAEFLGLQKPNITPALELGQVIPIGEAAACQGQEEAGRTMLEKPMDEVKGGAVKDDLAIIEHQQEGTGQPQEGVEERKETRFLGNERGIGQEGFQSQGQPSQEAPGVPILPLEGIPYEGAEGVSELVQ